MPRRNKYPWDEWADGQIREITRGVDFECHTYDMKAQIFNYASRHGLKAVARIKRRVITFQFTQPADQ